MFFSILKKEKHYKRYAEFFAKDPSTDSQQASTFDEWLQISNKKGAWIDGLQLQALSEKFGQVIVIWSKDVQSNGDSVWQRYVYSSRFSHNYACHAKNTPAIALTLESGLYKLLIPPEGQSIPQRWLLYTEQPSREKLRGAGGSKAGSHRSKCTSVATPSVHTCTHQGSNQAKTDNQSVRTPTVYSPTIAHQPLHNLRRLPSRDAGLLCRGPTSAWPLVPPLNSPTSPWPSAESEKDQIALPKQPTATSGLVAELLQYRKLTLKAPKSKMLKTQPTPGLTASSGHATYVIRFFVVGSSKALNVWEDDTLQKHTRIRAIWLTGQSGKNSKLLNLVPIFLKTKECGLAQSAPKVFNTSRIGFLKLSKEVHLTKCYGITLKKLRSLKYKSPHWKAHHKKLVQDNSKKKKSQSDKRIQEHNKEGNTVLFRVPGYTKSATDKFSCAECTVIFQRLKDAIEHSCPGQKGRTKVMKKHTRCKLWAQQRKTNPQLVHHLVKNWKLTHAELEILEKDLPTKGGRNGVVPASQSIWHADLTEHGDIEPNPGPQSKAEPTRSGSTANVNGKENCWTFVRHIIQQRKDIAIAQEHCMNSKEQADLARFCLRHNYRSWYVAPPERNNVYYGQAYTTGGVAIIVKADKRCHEVNRHNDDSGQALMLQMDQAFIVGTYLPPRQEENNAALTALDEWCLDHCSSQATHYDGWFQPRAYICFPAGHHLPELVQLDL